MQITVKELMDKLKLVKNKDAEIVFKTGNFLLEPQQFAEILKDGDAVRFPELGETANAVVVKLSDIPSTKSE